jgi:hypothetical protein
MYMDLKERFWWNNMKRDIAEYIAKCDVCSRVKAEHQKPAQGYQKPNLVMILFGWLLIV